MLEPNRLPVGWRDAWSALASAFNDDSSTHPSTTSTNAYFPGADYDPDDAPPVLREEDPDLESRLDRMFELSPKF